MTGKISLIAALSMLSCSNEKSVSPPGNQAPEAQIYSPYVGEVVRNGALYTARGLVTDPDHSPEELTVFWVMGSEQRCGPLQPDTEGNTMCELSFGWDRTAVTLTVSDPDGAEGSVTVEAMVEEAEAPVVRITSPDDGAEFRESDLIYFTAEVSDGEDRPEGLGLYWESDVEGVLDMNHTVDSDGNVEGNIRLSASSHVVRLWATDTSGRTDGDEVLINVYPDAAAPTATITGPATGSVFAPGSLVVFHASVHDERDIPDTLEIAWSSSVDGPLGTTTADSSGLTSFSIDTLSEADHLITLTVTDSDGMTGTANVELTIGEDDTGI